MNTVKENRLQIASDKLNQVKGILNMLTNSVSYIKTNAVDQEILTECLNLTYGIETINDMIVDIQGRLNSQEGPGNEEG